METMGGSCSLQRRRRKTRGSSSYNSLDTNMIDGPNLSKRNFCRHSVVAELPDESISALYPLEDNYIIDDVNDNNTMNGTTTSSGTMNSGIGNGTGTGIGTTTISTRSPKTLLELCIDAVCRNLHRIEGDLPPGIPQNIVDSILDSLVRHSALNATTLRALRRCELLELPLSHSRGVSDDWLMALNLNNKNNNNNNSNSSSNSNSDADDLAGGGGRDGGDEEIHIGVNLNSDEEMVSNRDMNMNMNMMNMDMDMDMQIGAATKTKNDRYDLSVAPSSSDSSSSSDSDSASFHSAVSTPRKVPVPELTKPCDPPSPSQSYSPISTSIGYKFEEPSATAQTTLLDLRGSQQLSDRGLLQLTDLRSLEVARLDNCYSIVGKGLLALSNSHRLHTLSLSNCRCLTDEAVVNISHLSSSLTALSLEGCRCITDISMEAISNLYNLRKLELSQCDLITDEGLNHLESLLYIEELSLGWCRLITDEGIRIMTSQPTRAEYLESLCLARCRITNVGIGHLDKLASLRTLDLSGCSTIGSVALGNTLEKLQHLEVLDVSYCPNILRSSWQGKINSIRSLHLCYSAVKNAHLARLSDLPSLEEINMDSCPIGNWSLAHFADNNVVPNLKSLDLADTDVTDRGLVHIAKLKHLEHLSLFYCDITNAGLRHISQMESLQVLNLDSRDIGDSGMFFLRNLKNLKCLDVFSGRITDNGCSHIGKIQSLESLELCGGGVGDFGCHHLSKLENLTSLNLSQNERITNIGASSLAALTKLKALNLSNTGVTSDALPFFKGLRHLQSLAMYGCKSIQASDEMQDLQRDLPNLKCMRLSGSFDGDGTIESEESNDNGSIAEDDEISFADESDRESNFSFFVEDEEDEEEQVDIRDHNSDDENDDEDEDDDDDEVMEDEFEG